MIKAIIFDCFGVLVSEGLLPFLAARLEQDSMQYKDALDLTRQLDAGMKSYDTFLEDIAAMAGTTKAEAQLQIEHNVPDEAVFTIIRQLKPHYRIGMLSNAGDNWLDEMLTPDHLALFDAYALSYETGYVKPQVGAYQTIAKRLGVEPNECIFIDDQERYCTGAAETGMTAIVFNDAPSLATELHHLGVLPER